jgi:hypothetical protein
MRTSGAAHGIIAQGERHTTDTHFASADRTDPRMLDAARVDVSLAEE